MPFDGSNVYQLANSLGLPDLTAVARGAGVMSALQVSAYYAERRVRHSVARAIEFHTGEVQLFVAYEGVSAGGPMTLTLERDRIEKLMAVLLDVKFAKLGDQPGISYNERSLWLVQRAAGTHVRGVMLAPDRPELPWSMLVNAIDNYLPEAIREVPLRS